MKKTELNKFFLASIMFPIQRAILRIRRYFFRYSLLCRKRAKLNRIFKICLILIVGFLIINIVNGILFSSILFFQEKYQ